MSGLKPRRRSSSLTTCRSADISGSSTASSTVGGGVSTTSCAGGVVGVTGCVSTSRSCGGVLGFFFGQPYRTVNSNGTTIHIISLRFILFLSIFKTAGSVLTLSERDQGHQRETSRFGLDARPVGHVVVALPGDL